MKRISIISFGIFAFSCSLAVAAIERPPIRYTALYNNDIRHGEEDFYAHRLEAIFAKEFNFASQYQMKAQMVPFLDLRYNIVRQKRERAVAGIEFGLSPLSFFYVGQQFRYSWYSESLHQRRVIDSTSMPEALTKVIFSHQLIPGKEILKGYFGSEYTYDFRHQKGVRAETLIGLIAPIGKSCEVDVNWRHRDRVHDYDCDTFETSVSYTF